MKEYKTNLPIIDFVQMISILFFRTQALNPFYGNLTVWGTFLCNIYDSISTFSKNYDRELVNLSNLTKYADYSIIYQRTHLSHCLNIFRYAWTELI